MDKYKREQAPKDASEIEPLTKKYNKLEEDIKKARKSTDKFLSELATSRKSFEAKIEAKKTKKELILNKNLQEAWDMIKEEELNL